MSDTLVLNADYRPLSWLPLSLCSWQESIRQMVLGRVSVIEWHDHWWVRSERWSTQVPSIIALRDYQKPKQSIRYSKQSVFLRDGYRCQYCGLQLSASQCTLDHVKPLSLGGRSTFENSTTACSPCNGSKGNRLIRPRTQPFRPTAWQLIEQRQRQGFQVRDPRWLAYLEG
jgi:5-methylcytosine-specific restriction endonuclease McrA